MPGREWQQGHYSGLFDGSCQFSLVLGTGPGYAAWQNLTPFRDKMPQCPGVFVVYGHGFVRAEATDFSANIYAPAFAAIICWSLSLHNLYSPSTASVDSISSATPAASTTSSSGLDSIS